MKKTFENLLIEHCAPTLAGVKTANLFCYEATREEACSSVDYWSEKLLPLGVQIMLIKSCYSKNNSLVYVFREKSLIQDLKKQDVLKYLASIGYGFDLNIPELLSVLSCRLTNDESFPHEIGLFLGYPLHDVLGFIHHQGKNFCCSGCWKIYENPEQAQKCFAQYKNCSAIYQKMYQKGKSIIQLTLAA
ncbi:MAG: DUF3793 family protein [Bacillota bacterium]|nr:DUF3793 family protein [Bacillota bacterium]